MLFTSPPREHEAWSTNYDIWRVAADGKGKPENLTKDNPAAQKLLQRVAHTVNTLSESSQYKPDQTPILQQKEQALARKERELWNQETDQQTTPIIRTAARKALSTLTAELKRELTSDDRATYVDDLEKGILKYASKDEAFMSEMKRLTDKRDRDGIIALIKSSRAKFVNPALKDLYRAKFLDRNGIKNEAASKTEAAGGGGAAAGKASLAYQGRMKNGAPDVAFDYERMRSENPDMLYDHEFYIVGKKEKYRW